MCGNPQPCWERHANYGMEVETQAPDTLWLAQRLVGPNLLEKKRPEYSYTRNCGGNGGDSGVVCMALDSYPLPLQLGRRSHTEVRLHFMMC